MEAENFEAAENVLQQAIAKDPQSLMANYWKGKVYFMQSRWKEAESSFFKAIQLDSEFADTYFHTAMCYLGMDQNLKSYEIVQHLVRLGAQDQKERLFEMFALGAGVPVEQYRRVFDGRTKRFQASTSR